SFRVITTTANPDKSTRPLTEADLRTLMQETDPDFRFALVIPADLIRDDDLGLHLKILSNPRNDIETQTVNGILQKAIFSNAPQLLGQSLQAPARRFLALPQFKDFNARIASAVADSFGGEKTKIQKDIEPGNFGLPPLATPDEPADTTTAST